MFNLSWLSFLPGFSTDDLCTSETAGESGREIFHDEPSHRSNQSRGSFYFGLNRVDMTNWSNMLDALNSSFDHRKLCSHCNEDFDHREKRILKKSTGQFFHKHCLEAIRKSEAPRKSWYQRRAENQAKSSPKSRFFRDPRLHHLRGPFQNTSENLPLTQRAPLWRFQYHKTLVPDEERILAPANGEQTATVAKCINRIPFRRRRRPPNTPLDSDSDTDNENINPAEKSLSSPKSRALRAFSRRRPFHSFSNKKKTHAHEHMRSKNTLWRTQTIECQSKARKILGLTKEGEQQNSGNDNQFIGKAII